MRKARKNTATRQIIHIVGEGLTELFYFSHLKKKYLVIDTLFLLVYLKTIVLRK